MTDKEIRDTMEATLSASTEDVAQRMVETHINKVPHLKIIMGICMNPGKRPWENNEGVKLVEVCEGMPSEAEPNFDYTEFSPEGGWPRLKILLTGLSALNIDLAQGADGSFYAKLKTGLLDGSAKSVYPVLNGAKAAEHLDALLGPADGK